MRISIITVCFGAQDTIEETLRSIAFQTYRDIQYIVIDGGSKDDTCNIIGRYKDCIDYFVSESDKGIYDAMNKGLVKADGDYLLFLGADDHLVSSDTIERVVARINNARGDVFYGDVLRFLCVDRVSKSIITFPYFSKFVIFSIISICY